MSRSSQSEHWKGPCAKNELFMEHSQCKLNDGFWCACQKKTLLCDWHSYLNIPCVRVHWSHVPKRFPKILVVAEIFIIWCNFTGKLGKLECLDAGHLSVDKTILIFGRPPCNSPINLKLSANERSSNVTLKLWYGPGDPKNIWRQKIPRKSRFTQIYKKYCGFCLC